MAGPERGSGDEAASTTELSPEQRAIVEWGEGPLVVIAGAETGKTRVIVERVRQIAMNLVEVGFFEKRGTKMDPDWWVPFLYRPALDMVQGSAD
jgi:hypothetical protein